MGCPGNEYLVKPHTLQTENGSFHAVTTEFVTTAECLL